MYLHIILHQAEHMIIYYEYIKNIQINKSNHQTKLIFEDIFKTFKLRKIHTYMNSGLYNGIFSNDIKCILYYCRGCLDCCPMYFVCTTTRYRCTCVLLHIP